MGLFFSIPTISEGRGVGLARWTDLGLMVTGMDLWATTGAVRLASFSFCDEISKLEVGLTRSLIAELALLVVFTERGLRMRQVFFPSRFVVVAGRDWCLLTVTGFLGAVLLALEVMRLSGELRGEEPER